MSTHPQPADTGGADPSARRGEPDGLMRKAILGATIGAVIEWFDVAIYAYLAAVLGKVFFPATDSATALLGSFAVFAAAFVVRPLGGMFFGTLGDRIGRKKTLSWVILTVSAATMGIGLLPDYSSVGLLAPVLLVIFRLAQGFSAGGEVGGASAFVAEHSPPRRRGFMVSWVELGGVAGFLLGSVVVLILNLGLTPEDVQGWGWRIPFLLAAPLGLVGFYIRNKLEETPEFESAREQGALSRRPVVESLVTHRAAVARTAGIALFQNVMLYVTLSYVPSHQEQILGYSPLAASTSAVSTMIMVCLAIPIAGGLSDVYGRRMILGASCVVAVIASYPLFLLMESGSVVLTVAAHIGLGLIVGVFLGPNLAAMNELFPTRVRYAGLSIGYNVAVSLFGGTAPLLVTFIITRTGVTTAAAFYLIAAAIVTFVVIRTMPETAPRCRESDTTSP